jgi:hypothetical protein
MSPIQATGQAAVGFVDALKSQPLLLVLAVTNFATLGFVYFQANTFSGQRQDNIKLFIEQQVEFNKLLSKCIVMENKTDLRLPPFKSSPVLKDINIHGK